MRRNKNPNKALRNTEGPGADKMPAELLKYGGNEVVKIIHKLIVDIWDKAYVAKECRKLLYAPSIRKEISWNERMIEK
jgi:hypothetical protein